MKEPQNQDRFIKLSEVTHVARNYREARLTVEYTTYVGETTRMGGKLLSDVGMACGETAAPQYLKLFTSESTPGEYVMKPTNVESDDHLPISWVRNGRFARISLGKLLALKKIEIPDGTRMVIELTHEKDSKHGDVVGLKLNDAGFEAIKSKARKTPPPASA